MSEEWANIEGKLVMLKKRRWWQIWKPRKYVDEEYPVTVKKIPSGTDLTPYLTNIEFKGNVLGSKFEKRVAGTFGGGDEDE